MDERQDVEEDPLADLRGVPTHLLLRRLGRVFSNGQGEASTFAMSAQVETIDVFLSHSWATPSSLKTAALMYRSNVSVALILSTSVMVSLQILRRFTHEEFLNVQSVPFNFPGGGKPYRVMFSLNVLVYCSIFMVALVYGAEVGRCFVRYSMCFLDKCCIHQTDPVKKMRGIHQLGNILARSKRMVVLWQPEYLSRLWCVWELAAFSSLSEGSVEFLPLKLPLFVIGLFLFHFAATAGAMLVGPHLIYAQEFAEFAADMFSPPLELLCNMTMLFVFNTLVYASAGIFLWKFCIWHMDDRRELIRVLKHFKVEDAQCYLPTDRVFMLSSIEGWFGSVERFEALVQEDLSKNVLSSLRHSGPVPYSMLLIGALPHAFLCIDSLLDSRNHHDLEGFVRALSMSISLTFCTDALSVDVGLFLAEWSHSSRGRSRCWKYLGPIGLSCFFAALTALPLSFMNRTIPYWLVLAMIFIMMAATLAVHAPRRHSESWTLPTLSRGSMRVASISSCSREGSIATSGRGETDSFEMQVKTSLAYSASCFGGSTFPTIEEEEQGGRPRRLIVKLDEIYTSETAVVDSVEIASSN